MSDKQKLQVEYTINSLNNSIEIVEYLRYKFSIREVNRFYQLLSDFEKVVGNYPEIYPESEGIKLRKAVLSKNLSIIYKIMITKIVVIAVLDNRWDKIRKIK